MKKQFIFVIGIHWTNFAIHHYLQANSSLLARQGVIYPDMVNGEKIYIFSPHRAFYNLFEREYDIQRYCESIITHFENIFKIYNTIILSWYDWKNVCISQHITENIHNFLRQHFPYAQQRALLSLIPQDIQIEYHLATAHMGHTKIVNYQTEIARFGHPLDNIERIQAYEKIFGRPDACISLDATTNGQDNIRAIHRMLQFAGLSPQELARADYTPPPYAMHTLPREFLRFASNYAHAVPSSVLLIPPPWSTQASRFTPQAGYPYGHSLLGPEARAELRRFYLPSNAVLAHKLGLEQLFPDPDPEPDWQPFTGLTPETAFAVASRLDRDFARDRMAEFDALPAYYLTREGLIVRQALHDALDPPSAAPLIRQRPEPKLSVLTLAYNHAPLIAQNIESVLAQRTNFPIQHIIADDGSDDGTQDIILEYADKYPHIVPIFQKKRSYGSKNVFTLFDMARTEYAAICDGDDYFTDPAKLQTQVDFLDQHKDCGLCFHVVRVAYENQPERERLYPPVEELPRGIRPFYYLSDLIKCNLIQTNSVMYRWRFKNGLPDWFRADLMPGDWYWHLLHAETGKIGFINKVMSVYRRHEKGVYYLSEIDRLKHRATVGLKEIEVYDVINKHFNRKYESILLDLVNGVFADCLLYDTQRAEKENAEPVLNNLCDAYPTFARHFLASLKVVSNSAHS